MDFSATLNPDVMETDQNITEGSSTINPYLNGTNPSELDIYSSSQTNWTTARPAEDDPHLAALWTYLAVRLLWGGLALFGNSLIIFAVTKFERLQTCTNYLICSLAVSDLMSCLLGPLIMVHKLYLNRWFFVPVCLVQETLALISIFGNQWSILYLSIDRYIYIAFPLRYHTLVTPQRIVIVLTVTWTSVLIGTPTVVFAGNHLQVGIACRVESFLNEWIAILYLLPQIVLVFCSTIGFHLAIAKIAHDQGRRIQAQPQGFNGLDVAINQSTRKISRTLGLVLGVYVLSIMPRLILVSSSFDYESTGSIEKFTVALYWVNSWVNPLIYAGRLKDFKIAFKKIFTGTGSFIEVPGINL